MLSLIKNFCIRCIPAPIAERYHTHPPLLFSLVWFIALLVVVSGSAASENAVSVPLLIFLFLNFLFSFVALMLEIILHYKVESMKRDPNAPQSYMEMTNTDMRIHSDDPIRRDALNYDIAQLENTRQQFESVQARNEYIDESDILKLDMYSFQVVLPTVISVSIVLTIRLFAIEHFATVPIQLNFGPKYDGSEDNVSFVKGDANSYGHWIQGVLAGILLFPAVTGTIVRGLKSETRSTMAFVFLDILAACMTIYSSYNFIKRMVRSADVFATSSFANNATEWILGVSVGASLGFCATAMYKYYVIAMKPDSTIPKKMKTIFDELSMKEKIVLLGIRIPKGLLLLMTAFSSGLMIALSWNNCEDNSQDCVNYSPDEPSTGLIVIMLLIPMLITVLFKVYYYYRGPPTD